MPLTCAYCPVRVLEKRMFSKRLRCSVSGRYVALGMACGAETEQLREAVAALSKELDRRATGTKSS